MTARIFQLNVSPGGVPKRPVPGAQLTALGLEGDAVAHPRIHGGPMRALCLYSLERIRALQEEGASIFPGAIGENVTIEGVDWSRVVPGAQLALGDALVEVTSYAEPCRTTAPYVLGDLKRYHAGHRPGWSRVYAKVLQPARLEVGMPVRVVSDLSRWS